MPVISTLLVAILGILHNPKNTYIILFTACNYICLEIYSGTGGNFGSVYDCQLNQLVIMVKNAQNL